MDNKQNCYMSKNIHPLSVSDLGMNMFVKDLVCNFHLPVSN